MLLYAPACRQEDFTNAIGYLIRRLDENTGPGQFPAPRVPHRGRQRRRGRRSEQQFVAAYRGDGDASAARRAGRRIGVEEPSVAESRAKNHSGSRLLDSSTLDFPQRARHRLVAAAERRVGRVDRRHMAAAVRRARGRRAARDRRRGNRRRSTRVRDSLDPSRPGVVVARYRQATRPTSTAPSTCARRRRCGWRTSTAIERQRNSAPRRRRACRRPRRPDGRDARRGRQDARRRRPRSLRGDRLLPVLRRLRPATSTSCPASRRRARASSSSSRRGIFRWRFPAAASRRRWRPATR